MHYKCVFTMLKSCVLAGLDWAEPMMFLLLHVTCSCIFHAYVQFYSLSYWYWSVLGTFFLVSLSPSLSIQLVCSMAPKKNKSTLSQNPLRSRASTSDSTPSHIRFHDDKARTDFSENFSRRDIHLERQVVLSNFSNIDLPTVVYNRGW